MNIQTNKLPDNPQIEVIKSGKTGLFTNYIFKAIPLAFDESLSYYECLCGLLDYLKNVIIPTVNNNADAVAELQTLYIELKTYVDNAINEYEKSIDNKVKSLENYMNDYFNNLDVQEEINNKLDKMVEDGTLPEIITTYIQSNVTWTFDNIAEMQSATNLINGSYAQTLGYYSIDDGGKSLYYITNSGTADGGKVIALSGGLYAHLIFKDVVYVEQFGAKGDGTTDDQDAINLALASGSSIVSLTSGKTYLIKGFETGQRQGGTPEDLTDNTGIVIPSNTIFDLNTATISINTNDRTNYNGITIASVHDVEVKNGTIIGDRKTHTGTTGQWGYGISLRNASNVTLKDLNISECWGDGINVSNDGDPNIVGKNVEVINCICDSNRRQGMSIENIENMVVKDSQFINTGNDSLHNSPSAGIDIEPYMNSGNVVKNVLISNCIMNNNYGAGFISSGVHSEGAKVEGVTIENCIIKDNQVGTNDSGSVMIIQSRDVKFINNKFSRSAGAVSIILRPENPLIFDSNIITNGRLLINGNYLNKSYVKIVNNEFYNELESLYNGVIECNTTTASNDNNILYVIGNTFIGATPTLNIQSMVIVNVNSKFTCAKIINNTFKHGRRGIEGNASFVIKGNIFQAQYEFCIYLTEGNSSQITEVSDNVFEAVNFNNSEKGLIWNRSKLNTILQNNNYYDVLLSGESLTVAHKPERMLLYTNVTGLNINVNNNFNTTS